MFASTIFKASLAKALRRNEIGKNIARLMAFALLTVTVAPAINASVVRLNPRGNVLPRKEFRKLTTAEWNDFVAAVKKLNEKSQSTTAISRYDTFTNAHINWANYTHNYAPYLPWHRIFLREFELALQQINPNVTLPYWDWSLDSQSPEASPLFKAAYMGGNGTGVGMVVTNGPFAYWRLRYPSLHSLRRNFNSGTRINPLYSSEAISRILSTSRTYDAFRRAIEIAAGPVHIGIGGDMASMAAPNDPIYWLHMAYIDKLWARWQSIPSNISAYGGPNPSGYAASSNATLNDVLQPFPETVRKVLVTQDIGYFYKD